METIENQFDLTEIINGEEIMGLSPFGKHQRIVGKLYMAIGQHVKINKLGEVFVSPLDVIFEEGKNRLQPDILFIRSENMGIFQDWIRGVPDMVCEVISPGSYEQDASVKREIYERYKVPEYWLVLPELKSISILTIENDKYRLHSFAAHEGAVNSKVIDGLQINVEEIFV